MVNVLGGDYLKFVRDDRCVVECQHLLLKRERRGKGVISLLRVSHSAL